MNSPYVVNSQPWLQSCLVQLYMLCTAQPHMIAFSSCSSNSPMQPYKKASQVAHWVKNPPEMQEIWVRSPGSEDPLEEGMATHSSVLAWRVPWTGDPVGLRSIGLKKNQT